MHLHRHRPSLSIHAVNTTDKDNPMSGSLSLNFNERTTYEQALAMLNQLNEEAAHALRQRFGWEQR